MPQLNLLNRLLDGLLPDSCTLCDAHIIQKPQAPICSFCESNLPLNVLVHTDNPDASVTLAPLAHEGEARHLINQLKFHRGVREGLVLAMMMTRQINEIYTKNRRDSLPESLLAVPLSNKNYLSRGYNQAGLLAKMLGRKMNIPVLNNTVRKAHGTPQRTLTRKQRLALPANTFRVTKRVRKTHIAIIDDVMTTGRTTQALKQILQQHNPCRVDIWCATQTPVYKPTEPNLRILVNSPGT